jgi:beta-lactamase class A
MREFGLKDSFAMIDRRGFLVAASGLLLSPVLAVEAPPVLAAYERETGGRIGVDAENLSTGARIAWRAEERFVMCSTFKASLAACVLARVDKAEDRLEDMVAYGPKDILDYAPVAKQNLSQASRSVAVWPKSGGPVLVCTYTQGGSPTPQQLEAVFKEIGAMVGRQL